jgi:ankyrin repeat protein
MLHEAARKETKEKFQRLVSKLGKASVHVKERDYEQTPLHCACGTQFLILPRMPLPSNLMLPDSGNQEVASLLLEKYKVEVNIVDKNGWTPLHSACNAGKLSIVDMLLNKGAFPR